MEANIKREKWIDICKGIGIILVVLGHVTSSYHNSGMFLDNPILNYTNKFVYYFHMPLFFFISGWLESKRSVKRNKKEQIKNCLISYGIPYLLFSIIYFILKKLTSNYVNTKLSLLDLLCIPFIPISFMWFIYALLIISILSILLDIKSMNKKRQYATLIITFIIYIYI